MNLRIKPDAFGDPYAIFEDRHNETAMLEDTPWRTYVNGKEENILLFTSSGQSLYLTQSDIRELLPYLQRFADTGKLTR